MPPAIEVKELSKRFGRFTAVDRVSFQVSAGEIFGFLGSNGAGKSTTIRMLCGLMLPTSGQAWVNGMDVTQSPEKVKTGIGYMSQRFSLYDDLTVIENIRFFGGIYGLRRGLVRRVAKALAMADLSGHAERMTGELPGGFKQRLALACALLHTPSIVFLDEPTGGVDPISRRHFWRLINNLSEQGITVFVTTHFLDEAEYCHTLMLIHQGRIIAGGTPEQLKQTTFSRPLLELEVDKPYVALAALKTQPWAEEVTLFGHSLHLSLSEEAPDLTGVHALLKQDGLHVKRLEPVTPSLEDVFIHVIEHGNKRE